MPEETTLSRLLSSMNPILNEGEFVFCSIDDPAHIDLTDAIGTFWEKEGLTAVMPKVIADKQHLPYTFIASWITLTVHSSLESTGLSAAFSKALAEAHISCNIIAAFYHDHIFVARQDVEKALMVLSDLQRKHQ